ncbi:hypothetical protein TNCV_4856151 [Trichonephila clavipes]|nr:hypothetical protein TNCV_4856151 [Trichonephila clavipes]
MPPFRDESKRQNCIVAFGIHLYGARLERDSSSRGMNLVYPLKKGFAEIDMAAVNVIDSWMPCHEFEPSTTAIVVQSGLVHVEYIEAEMFPHCCGVEIRSFTPNAAVLFVDVAIQPEVRFIAKQNSLMKIGNNGNLVLGTFDESTPCLLTVLMNCQTKLRINHLTAVKSVAILERTAIRGFSSGRPRGTTPADDRYIVLQARRNRRQTAGVIARYTTQATGRPISRFTVARRLHGRGLFA